MALIQTMAEMIILESEVNQALKTSAEIENSFSGDWIFFDANDGLNVKAIFQIESAKNDLQLEGTTHIKAHKKFHEHLLGLFKPELKQELSIFKSPNFTDFCIRLNELLEKEIPIYDLSHKNLWIWHGANQNNTITIGKKLKDFLDLN